MFLNRRSLRPLRWLAATLAVVVAITAYYWTQRPDAARYITAEVTKGPIIRAVKATGTVNPVVTVQVGTYVSGPISALYVDFNSPVKAGQLMAKIDPRPYEAQVALASAALANAKAQLKKDQANLAYQKLTYERDRELLKRRVISQDQLDSQRNVFDQATAQGSLDQASIQQQQANLRNAELNLNYTDIVSPVDGTVVSRNIDVGQTVAASFQTPTLFLVAKDLTKMQVDTNTSESDVGGANIGEAASFTVDAYPGRIFKGVVTQVRQAPITVQNVVTYDVVVGVANPEMQLRPGMTANVTVVTDKRDDVLRVPLQALHFSPYRSGSGSTPPGGDNQQAASDSEQAGSDSHDERKAHVWVEDGGKLKGVPIVRGLDDGAYVEVVSGDLQPGELVVTDQGRALKRAGTTPMASSLRLPH